MLGSDGTHWVKVIAGGGDAIPQEAVASPFGGAEVKVALQTGYSKL